MAPRTPSVRRTPRRHDGADAERASADRTQRAARRSSIDTASSQSKRSSARRARVSKYKSPSISPAKRKLSPGKRILKSNSKRTLADVKPARRVIETDGIIPAWASLPYEILLTIFQYAALPLLDETSPSNNSLKWLLQTARICKSFAEPALTCMYECPPLWRVDMPHSLLDLLRGNSDQHYVNYRMKIRRLELHSEHTLAYSCPGRGVFKMSDIIPLLPRLVAIDITNQRNRPPFRKPSERGKWLYPNELFTSLGQSGIRLDSWRWHGDMLIPLITLPTLLHHSHAFSTLQRLTISNLYLCAKGETSTRKRKIGFAAEALQPLAQLSELILESCTSPTWDLLDSIPTSITSFSVINCPNFSTDHLMDFLNRHGRSLTHLVLNHNQSLDLTFLSALAPSCPSLRVLNIDLTYFSASILGDFTHRSDAEPRYEAVIHADESPTWPSSLQELKFNHLRKLTAETATTFFESLIDAAPTLKFLRTLVISAQLDISWRERAGFRERWINWMNLAFLRNANAPDPNLSSAKMFRMFLETAEGIRQHRGLDAATSFAGRPKASGGHCETVDISIGNLRPSEFRFTEEDFMDSDNGGADQDWDDDNDTDVDAPMHAW